MPIPSPTGRLQQAAPDWQDLPCTHQTHRSDRMETSPEVARTLMRQDYASLERRIMATMVPEQKPSSLYRLSRPT